MQNLIDRINALEQKCERLVEQLSRMEKVTESLITYLYSNIGLDMPPLPDDGPFLQTTTLPPGQTGTVLQGKLRV